MLKIKHYETKCCCFSFYKDSHARMKIIPEQKLPKMVNNNVFKFCFGREHPSLPSD